jgi:hypothetical protein
VAEAQGDLNGHGNSSNDLFEVRIVKVAIKFIQ